MTPLPPWIRTLSALLWLVMLIAAGWMLSQRLTLSGDLRQFLPSAQTPAQALLIDELGNGPGSRLLLIALSGSSPQTLAAQSQALRAELAADPRFNLVANGGDMALDAIPERLRPYRYLLSATLDQQPLDAEYLRAELAERVADLGSPAAGLIEPMLPSDPTLETLKLVENWEPQNPPQRLHGVWFDRAGQQALLTAETRAAGFDPSGQAAAVSAIQSAFNTIRGTTASVIALSGPGAFSVDIGARTAREARRIGIVDSIGLVLLLWIAYRSWKAPLLAVLPLASAGLAGLAAVALLFTGAGSEPGQAVHGITVAFGFTLIGVVQDYPIHLLSHQHAGVSPWATVRAIWPTLATGVIATCIAYLTFLVSGVAGLQQLAVFTMTGLVTAALVTRLLLPALIDPAPRDLAASPRLQALWRLVETIPHPRWSLLALAILALLVLWLQPGAFWQNDLAKLTPVPDAAMARDAALRAELGAPDVRYVLTIQGGDVETVLQASERLRPALDALVAKGTLGGYELAARYLPSAATQRARQARLPTSEALRTSLELALADSPFLADAFDDFIADVASARVAVPLRAQDLEGTALHAITASLLLTRHGQATGLIWLNGVSDPAGLATTAAAHGAQLQDFKQASESLVASYRTRVLLALAVAMVLLAATVWLALRAPQRVMRVLLPMVLSTLLVVAILRAFGVELNLFHLVALILAAGLGLDYALFFDHAGLDRAGQLRTFHALIVCSLITLLVFSLLALSSIPVLRAIGTTVALGVALNFALALLVSRQRVPR